MKIDILLTLERSISWAWFAGYGYLAKIDNRWSKVKD